MKVKKAPAFYSAAPSFKVKAFRSILCTGKRSIFKPGNSWLIFLLIISFAYLLRIMHPQVWIANSDLSDHISFSTRLHLTSFFAYENLNLNFFYQLLINPHGYTTVLFPYILYEIFFNLLNVSITESHLVYLHSAIGIISLASIYCFLSYNLGKRIALVSVALLAVMPIHIGLSRVHVGYQVLQSIFFYLSLFFLSKSCTQAGFASRVLYFITTFFYIGCDKGFAVGLFLHIIFICCKFFSKGVRGILLEIKQIYFNLLSPIFIFFPILAYIIITYFLKENGVINYGYMLDSSHSKSLGFGPNVVHFRHFMSLVGPVFIFFCACLVSKYEKILKNRTVVFLCLVFLVYFLLVSSLSNLDLNYVYFFLVPVVVLPVYIFSQQRILLFLIWFLTIMLSLSVVYGVNIGVETGCNYGSSRWHHDIGAKTLGYIVRKKELLFSEKVIDTRGVVIKHVKLYTGALIDHYVGTYFYGRNNIPESIEGNYLLAYVNLPKDKVFHAGQKEIIMKTNKEILAFVKRKVIPVVAYIVDGNQVLMTIFSNSGHKGVRYFDIKEYNGKFDKTYANLDSLAYFTFPDSPFDKYFKTEDIP